ncbi:MAG: stage V sporulation protein AE [Bacillota bacterium]|jgi:stage V sporulation protein AE|nr:stage V sporulation protein AE [Candidatus Fermentithermobacillaceae bacterium]
MTLLYAFLVGGALCALAQIVVDATKTNPAFVMVSAVSIGAVLSGLGLYGPLVDFAGAGAATPLFGFGHSLVTGMLEDAGRLGWFGLFTGGLRATASGLMAAIIFGYLMAVLFNPKG